MKTGGAYSFDVTVATNAPSLGSVLDSIAVKQLPFATAVALTRCAQDAQADLRASMGVTFSLRSKFLPQELRIKRANKRDWPHPFAVVGHTQTFMLPHVLGGEKTGRDGHNVAVPLKFVAKQRTARGTVPAKLKPRRLLQNPNATKAFRIPDDRIGQRISKRRSATGSEESLTLFFLRRAVKIRATWPFRETAENSTKRTYNEHFAREFDIAMRSARARSLSFSSAAGRHFWLKAQQSQLK